MAARPAFPRSQLADGLREDSIVDRRTFLGSTGAVLLAAPLNAGAKQAGKVYRIGFLSYRGCGVSLDPNGAFRQGLSELAYVEGQNLTIECRDARGRVDRFADIAAGLTRLKMDVLVAEGTPANLAAKAGDEDDPDRDGRGRGPRQERAHRQSGTAWR